MSIACSRVNFNDEQMYSSSNLNLFVDHLLNRHSGVYQLHEAWFVCRISQSTRRQLRVRTTSVLPHCRRRVSHATEWGVDLYGDCLIRGNMGRGGREGIRNAVCIQW